MKSTKPTTTTTITPSTKTTTRSKKRKTLCRSRLSHLCFLANSTNSEIAARLNMSPTLLASISTLRVVPSDQLLHRMGVYFGLDGLTLQDPISPSELFRVLASLQKAAV
jgi:hypothetical protein